MSRPPANGQRFGSKNGNMSFLTVSICNSRKKVKRDVVMNVEITDNSKEVSGAIHQVGQAIADTGAFCKPGSLCNKVSAWNSGHSLFPEVSAGIAGFLQMGKSGATRPRGSWDANRFAASPQVALASPSGGAGPPIGNYPKQILSLARALRNWYNRGSISARRCMP